MKVSFHQSGRTGNLLFQYTACKLISLLYGHEYVPLQDIINITKDSASRNKTITINEDEFSEIINIFGEDAAETKNRGDEYFSGMKHKNIILNGYFQKSDLFVPYRQQLISMILNENNNDYWIKNDIAFYVKDILYSTKHSIENLDENDIVINLRLDDFIQMPNPKSDILPPQYYLNILENLVSEFAKKQIYPKIYIVCDCIKYDWEHRYLSFFDKYTPILIQKPLGHDIALMRDANILIHSNSTLCWIASFFSTLPNKNRFIPKTFHYSNQNLNRINPTTDVLIFVKTLEHREVFNINYEEYNKTFIHPLSYCIPDECIITDTDYDDILKKNKKINLISDTVPNGERQYKFGYNEEKEYNQQYRNSWFAYTQKKGGWDCLRHYEIMANGCIPIFKNLENCPNHTLTSFPKELVLEASQFLNLKGEPFLPLQSMDNLQEYSKKILSYIRENCSASAASKYFINVFENHKKKSLERYYLETPTYLPYLPFSDKSRSTNILLIRCNIGVNYTRELLWIGLKNHFSKQSTEKLRELQEQGIEKYQFTVAGEGNMKNILVEYPKIDYLYKSFPEDNKRHLYGNGFTYSKKIEDDENCLSSTSENSSLNTEISTLNEEDIIKKTKNGFWDLVIFGKVGPDEGFEGTVPQMPLWEHVFKVYTREQIVFLYGGDECINLKYDNRYKEHIQKHSQYGHCFVRELDM
jgi:hypothetical protein